MHNILEAVNRGIRLALDDYEDNNMEDSISKSDVIQNDDVVKEKIEMNELIRQLSYYVAISEEGFIRLTKLAKKYHYLYKVKDINELRRIVNFIGSESYFTHVTYNPELLSIDLNWLDVSNITNMNELFKHNKFNGDISKWDVSNVNDMNSMFNYSEFNGDISKWDVSSVKNMSQMFKKSKFNQDISNWNVENVEHMISMFSESSFNQDLTKWNVSKTKHYMDWPTIQNVFKDSPLASNYKYWPSMWKKIACGIYVNQVQRCAKTI